MSMWAPVCKYIDLSQKKDSGDKTSKTAHDKLLELGYQYNEYQNKFSKRNDAIVTYTLPYSFDGVGTLIHINKENKKPVIFISSVRENGNADGYAIIDLELSKILTQYLEELESENE